METSRYKSSRSPPMWLKSWLLNLCIGLSITFGLLTPLEDPSASDKYSISYVTPEYWQIAIRNNESALVEGNILEFGDGLSCYVRQQGSNNTSSAKKQRDELEFDKLLENNLQKGVDIILEDVKECIVFMSGYWTYNYCPEIGLSQFHGNPKTTELYYMLGRSKKSSRDREFQLLYNNFDYYISEIVESGDICDITGNPRVVEIQYVCGAAADSATIQWIKEIRTCYYEVQMVLPKLCELEVLSSNEEKKSSNPVLCVDKKSSGGIVDLLGKYEPIFAGSDFYLLVPRIGSTVDRRKVLLYSGKHKVKDGFIESNANLYDNIGSAFSRMLYQQLLIPPDESDYKPGDEISWISDVVDLHGNYLTRLQFNLSSNSVADISLSSLIEFPESGNLLYHKQGTPKDVSGSKAKNSASGFQANKIKAPKGPDKDIKLLVMDGSDGVPQFLDVSEAEDLFGDMLSPEQLETVLREQGSLGEHETLEDVLKAVDEIDEHIFVSPLDEFGRTGTTDVHMQEPEIESSEGSEDIESDDSQVQYGTELYDEQEHLVPTTSPSKDSRSQDREGQDKEELQNEPDGLKNHLHDEL